MSLVLLGTEAAGGQQVRRFGAPAAAGAGGGTASPAPNALTALTKYLPTETITIYMAGIALLPDRGAPWLVSVMMLLTPLIVLLAYLSTAAKAYAANPANVPALDCELLLKMVFSALAFYLWIHTLPVPNTTEYTAQAKALLESEAKVYAFLAILCSPFFGFLEGICPLVRRRIPLFRTNPPAPGGDKTEKS